MRHAHILALPAALAFLGGPLLAQDLASFEKRVTVKVLSNGLTVLVCERPVAPVFAAFTHVDVGSVDEVPGITGIAHMFEHMAFKGTDTIGTTNYAEEEGALKKVEDAYLAYDAARTARTPDPQAVAALEKAWKDAMEAAQEYVVPNEFAQIVEQQGGTGLNAFTSPDQTGYEYTFPANRLELWAYLESERFLHPVFREFYKERDVVKEERRMRTESEPMGRLIEQFQAAAFTSHPYRQPAVGYMSDLDSFSATQAKAFYTEHYVPANMVVTIVGDVKAAEVVPIVEKYLGRLPAGPRPEPVRTVEPPQIAEKEIRLPDAAQPFYLEGYHKPSLRDPDDAVYEAVADILSNGRVSRLYRSLVRDKKIAAFAAGFPGYPGTKYPNLFICVALPVPGHTTDDIQAAIRAELERLKTEDVSAEELQMVKTRAKANLIRALGDNMGLAYQLAFAEAHYGDWRELFRQVDRIDKVTAADIRRIAKATFKETNRTIGRIVTLPAGKEE